MKTSRQIAGYACVALGFAVIVLIGYGVITPFGAASAASSMRALLLGLLPSVGLALVAFAAGLWLLRPRREARDRNARDGNAGTRGGRR